MGEDRGPEAAGATAVASRAPARPTDGPAAAAASLPPLGRMQRWILTALLAMAAAAWAVLVWQAGAMGDGEMGGMSETSLTMGLGAPLFVAMWVTMMVAMMFPAAAPMILTFARVQQGRRARGTAFVPTWVFVGAYLTVWTAIGVAAYGAAAGAEALAGGSMWLTGNAARIGGGMLVLAGVYQLTPVKDVCLSKCRTPLDFVLGSWREGYGGALRMGVSHGAYCFGCCWMLFAILFPLGVMNVAAMAAIAGLIFVEKALPLGPLARRLAAAALIAYGTLVIAVPSALPTML